MYIQLSCQKKHQLCPIREGVISMKWASKFFLHTSSETMITQISFHKLIEALFLTMKNL